jgi:predicted PurR-regulated permease PerM
MIDDANKVRPVTNVGAAAAIALLALMSWFERDMLLMMFAGMLLAVLLRTASEWVGARTRLGAIASLLVVLGAVVAIFGAAAWSRGSAIAEQLQDLQSSLPAAIQQVISRLNSSELGRWSISQIMRDQSWSSGVFSRAGGAISASFKQIATMLIAVYVGIALAAEPELYRRGFLRLFPPRQRKTAEVLLDKIGMTLRYWLLARAFSMCVVGALVTVGLLALRMPLAATFGTIAALLTFVPNIGPLVSAVLPGLVAFTISPGKTAAVIVLFCAVHMLEGLLVTPLAERRIVRLPPALTISVQVGLAVLAGPFGVALAAPLTVVGMVVVRTIYVERLELQHAPDLATGAMESRAEFQRSVQAGR